MTSPIDGDPLQQHSDLSADDSLSVRRTRSPTRDEHSTASTTSLPIRTFSPSNLASRASTLSSALSRSESPHGRAALSVAGLGKSSVATFAGSPSESYDTIRSLFVRAFSPTIAIYPSAEADDLAARKNLKNGFTGLVRPYGERVTGKVVVRDSVGASRAWDDFGVHFVDLAQLAHDGTSPPRENPIERLEELLEQYLEQHADTNGEADAQGELSPYYRLFLSRLLRSQTLSPHETFLHPVGTVIVITSATPQPIETLRQLYSQTAQGSRVLPAYANPEYLRYYVLVHDEDQDDFAKSSALFDQMKRHFGLHCHLLRLRSAACTQSDDDAEEHPQLEWLTPTEDLDHIESTSNLIDLNSSTSPFVFASDATALRTFVRELVAQSIIPHMEQRIAFWNEQIASRRRGLSGRFMSLSKRWAGIGSTSRNASSATNLGGSGASGNYDSVQGFYRYDTSEALLRKLADYTFMLRDYKLASSTYELLRTDYANDKSWKYLAGANEMCCAATLLNPMANSGSSKFKIETFDQMLETATYSYLTRCSDPTLALRTVVLGLELLKVRGRGACEMAAKWATRGLELGLVGSVGDVLISERIAKCFSSQIGVGNTSWGTRRRKAAFWNVMAADQWMKLGKAEFAAVRLDEARELYEDASNGFNEKRRDEDEDQEHNKEVDDPMKGYREMTEFMNQLDLAVRMKLGQARLRATSGTSGDPLDLRGLEVEDETVEEMTRLEKLDSRATNRRSMIGPGNPTDAGMGMAVPLSPVRLSRGDPLRDDDDFE